MHVAPARELLTCRQPEPCADLLRAPVGDHGGVDRLRRGAERGDPHTGGLRDGVDALTSRTDLVEQLVQVRARVRGRLDLLALELLLDVAAGHRDARELAGGDAEHSRRLRCRLALGRDQQVLLLDSHGSHAASLGSDRRRGDPNGRMRAGDGRVHLTGDTRERDHGPYAR